MQSVSTVAANEMRELLASTLLYGGLILTGIGVLWLIVAALRHSRWLPTLTLAVTGIVLICVGWSILAGQTQVTELSTRLDEFMPAYEFNEVHTIQINASPDQVYRAIQSVTAREITLFLTSILSVSLCLRTSRP